MKYISEDFNNTTVQLDGNTFESCNFRDCVLEYSGGRPPSIVKCVFTDSSFTFAHQAGDTIKFMTALYHGGFKPVIEHTFEQIRNPATKSKQPNA